MSVATTSEGKIVVPHLYLGTNVLLDVIETRRRKPASEELLENIRNRRWLCSTAHFTLMEAIEALQEEKFIEQKRLEGWTLTEIARRREERKLEPKILAELYEEMRRRLRIVYPFIRYYYLPSAGWDEAVELSGKTNIDPSDCIHLATAKELRCDLLVSRDSTFRNLASEYIETASPEEVDKKVRAKGFEIPP